MSYIIERDDIWEATFEVEHVQGVKSVDLTVYYWEKYDDESGDELGTETEIRAAKIHLAEGCDLICANDDLAWQLTENARQIFYVSYGSIELWDKKKFEDCVSDCVIEPDEE